MWEGICGREYIYSRDEDEVGEKRGLLRVEKDAEVLSRNEKNEEGRKLMNRDEIGTEKGKVQTIAGDGRGLQEEDKRAEED